MHPKQRELRLGSASVILFVAILDLCSVGTASARTQPHPRPYFELVTPSLKPIIVKPSSQKPIVTVLPTPSIFGPERRTASGYILPRYIKVTPKPTTQPPSLPPFVELPSIPTVTPRDEGNPDSIVDDDMSDITDALDDMQSADSMPYLPDKSPPDITATSMRPAAVLQTTIRPIIVKPPDAPKIEMPVVTRRPIDTSTINKITTATPAINPPKLNYNPNYPVIDFTGVSIRKNPDADGFSPVLEKKLAMFYRGMWQHIPEELYPPKK